MFTVYLLLAVLFNSFNDENCSIVDSNKEVKEIFQNVLLLLHNEYRSNVTQGKLGQIPSASNMKSLEWEESLADLSQTTVERCHFEHADIKDTHGYTTIGENIAMGTLSDSLKDIHDVTDTIKRGFSSWTNESQWFKYPNECSKPCIHFTQLVWAATGRLGCGLAECNGIKGISAFDGKLTYLMVCNYGPGGNTKGESPYIKGSPCSACPADAKECDKQKLCG